MRPIKRSDRHLLKRLRSAALTVVAGSALMLSPIAQAQPQESDYLMGLQRMGLSDVLEAYCLEQLERDPNSADAVFWRTELGKKYLYDNNFSKPIPYGTEFVLFSMCYQQQFNLVDKNASAALMQLAQANSKWFEMKSMLPRTEDFDRLWVETGRWEALESFYGGLFLPYYSANAKILIAMRGPASEYMIKRSERAGFDYARERKRLLDSAISSLNGMTANLERFRFPTRAGVYISLAQAYALNGQASKGLGAIDKALALNSSVDTRTKSSENWRRQMINAMLTKSLVQEKMGNPDGAIATAKQMLGETPGPFAKLGANDILYALIIAGRIGVVNAMSDQRPRTYDGFKMVINDPRWSNHKANIENMMYNLVIPAEIGKPPKPRNPNATQPADGETPTDPIGAYVAAMREWNNAINLHRTDKEKAKPIFQKAIDLYDEALKGADQLGEGPKRDAMFNKGYCYYYLGSAQKSSESFLAYAKEFPPQDDNPKSKEMQAIKAALKFALDVYNFSYVSQDPATRNPQSLRYFLEVVNYVENESAYDDRGVLDGMMVVVASAHAENKAVDDKAIEKAIDWYQKAEDAGEDIIDAKVGKLFIFYDQWLESSGEPARILRSKVQVEGEGLVKEIEKALPGISDEARKKDLIIYLGQAQIFQAEAMTDTGDAGNVGAAVEIINNMEKDPRFANDKGMYREGIRIKIKALQVLGDYQAITKQVQEIVAKEPELAGTLLLPVLTSLEEEIARLERRRQLDESRKKGEAALVIAKEVRQWAEKYIPQLTGDAFDDKLALYYDLIVAKSMVSAGKYGEAVGMLQALRQKHGSQLTILAALADANMRQGGVDGEDKAVKLYTEIIEGLETMEVREKLYPDWRGKQAEFDKLAANPEPTRDEKKAIRKARQDLLAAKDLLYLYWKSNYEVLDAVERSRDGKKPEIAKRILFLQKRVDDNLGEEFDVNISNALKNMLNKHGE